MLICTVQYVKGHSIEVRLWDCSFACGVPLIVFILVLWNGGTVERKGEQVHFMLVLTFWLSTQTMSCMSSSYSTVASAMPPQHCLIRSHFPPQVAQPQRAKASDWRWFEASLHVSLSIIFHIREDLSRSSFTVTLCRSRLVLQEEPAAQRHALWFHCYRFSLLSISLKSLKLAFAKATVPSLLGPSQTRQILPPLERERRLTGMTSWLSYATRWSTSTSQVLRVLESFYCL